MLFPQHKSALALLVGGAGLLVRPAGATAVNVALEASFGAPPYLLELLETAAQENSSSYFPLLDRIAEGHFADYSTEKELYEGFLKTLEDDGHITSPEALSSFQLALSIHSAAPRIEAHYQYYTTSIDPILMKAQDASCPIWVHFGGKQYCSPALERAQQDFEGPSDRDLSFDRLIRQSDDLPVSTLYVDINSPLFGHFHQTLSETAKAGHSVYRVRYRPSLGGSNDPLRISGYGVELQLKRTDYIVIDDREAEKSAIKNEKPVSDKDLDNVADLKPLSASELLGLGLKTSSYILNSENPLDTLVRISQDFPKYSSSISHLNTTVEFQSEHEANREILLPPGFNILWMNGLQVTQRQMDAFYLLERLRQERGFVTGLKNAGLTASEAIALMSHSAITEARASTEVQRYDWRDDVEGGKVIIWLNNIEKDSRYADWPTNSSALLQRMYPGQLPTVRRDIHNLIIPLDFSTLSGVETIVETLYILVQRLIPVRFGFVPISNSKDAMEQAQVVYYLRDTFGIGSVLAYFKAILEAKSPGPVLPHLIEAIAKNREPRKGQELLPLDGILRHVEYQNMVKTAIAYLKRLGATPSQAPAFVNGVPVSQSEQWMQIMSQRISFDLQALQQKVYTGVVSDDAWLAGEFLTNAVTHRNPLIVPEDEDDVKLVDVANTVMQNAPIYSATLPAAGDATIDEWAELIVVADQATPEGELLVKAAHELKSTERDSSKGVDVKILNNIRSPATESSDEFANNHKYLYTLGFKTGESGVVVNGRRVGPMTIENVFSVDNLEQLLKYEQARRLGPLEQALKNLSLIDKIQSPHDLASVSALVALSAVPESPQGIYENSGAVRMDAFNQWKDEHSTIVKGNEDIATVQIVGSLDPTSELAQRWIPILTVLSELEGVYLKLFLNPKEKMQELPVKRFYRYVLDSKPKFAEDGSLLRPAATFEGVPREALLNLGLDTPPAWLVSPKESVYDPDNLKLSAVKSGDVDTVYQLDNILIEGHSRDVTTGQAPRGAQLLLGTERNPQTADTLVMANLGYFQFKANPGYYTIQLKPGRTAEIFAIDDIGGDDEQEPGSSDVALISWQGKTLYPKFSRKAGKETEDVLEEPKLSSPGDMLAKAKSWGQSILSKTGAVSKRKHADINIFSVASGHLYERMLNIMMVSVMKHTKHSVKFWFIEQFLSPSFKVTIPHLAREYGFEYELVTYKWPHWLRAQKEKQREIWGYKILFLDVLFPLDLDKVIFVDSDQIVRTDMYELVTHDLQGAPYGFTPMCDSRTEMEGFRFWKQGYWKNFLRGLPYHISALYVVDLKRFRQIAAGDRLRQQYHQLSADPNSLSNLDQDLPNNMQMQMPIHSLPQEWLWCETWCSDESLKDARTIDLCNNPLTKEPKLDRARRQVPEWTVYDNEIAEVIRKAREKEGNEAVAMKAADGASIQEEMDIAQKKAFDEKKQDEVGKQKIKDEL